VNYLELGILDLLSSPTLSTRIVMCILFIAVKQHPDFPLIIAANRDEFHARVTSPSHSWSDNHQLFAGRDEQAGGTWMGIHSSGRVAALTNIRAPQRERMDAKTRGELVVNALETQDDNRFLDTLRKTADEYNGYNLVYGNLDSLSVFNSHSLEHHQLTQGVYGLSNASLNTPWPKVQLGVDSLNKACQKSGELDIEDLFAILHNREIASDEHLPDTGIAKSWEKMLSSIFICSPDYGTRSSTILTVDNIGKMSWEERSYDANGVETGRVHHQR